MTDLFHELLFRPEPIIWVQQTLGLGWPLPFRIFSLLGTAWGVILAFGVALWLWGREVQYALAGIVLIEAASNLAMNPFLRVPRPSAPAIVKYEQVPTGAFPSGHVYTATVLWGLLSARGLLPYLLTGVLVFLCGLARLYLGTHYLADVVAAILLGVVLIWIFRRLWPPVRRWFAEHSFGFFVGAAVVLLAIAIVGYLFFLGGSSYRAHIAGLVAGVAVGWPLEWRRVGFRPARVSPGQQVLKLGIGLAGIVPLVAVERLTGEDALLLGAALAFLATLWAVWLAPALFRRMGLSEPDGHRAAQPT